MTLVEAPATRPTLQMQRFFDAPRALVWRAWTSPEVMVLWLGPVEWPAVSASQDLRVGGEWRACLRSPATGQDLWQGGVYREIVPEERLVFTFKWDESHEDGPPADTLVTVQLRDAPGGGTLMDFTHEGLKSEQSLVGHRHGWTSTFERLEAFLAAGGADR
ncbi:SRPBCC domain-containing protein [Brevundimonas sp.]|uniref:SRPBCC family protein n=1 Tax=Brevundimonas sp. TaxID=1871086 RepID=UPI002D638004|nr:SRPBCC domain-containing protein [Brevundimonas sp.]HYD29061.1 SRPBCC domain-containing protein [Brevundimonas sp.]